MIDRSIVQYLLLGASSHVRAGAVATTAARPDDVDARLLDPRPGAVQASLERDLRRESRYDMIYCGKARQGKGRPGE